MIDSHPRNILFVINDGPYGNERAYSALRLALNLVKRPEATVRVFLTGDGVQCARKGQKRRMVITMSSGWLNPWLDEVKSPLEALAVRLAGSSLNT